MGAVGNDLVHVHVALGAGAGLPDHQGELRIEFAGQDLVADFGDEIFLVGREQAQFVVGLGGSLFKMGKCINDLLGHAGLGADLEVVAGTFRLCAPVFVG